MSGCRYRLILIVGTSHLGARIDRAPKPRFVALAAPSRLNLGYILPPPKQCGSQRLRTVVVTRYVTPLREGGSVPAIVEADDDGMYVIKWRGAGQGPKALIAELVAGEIGRAAGLPVPEIVLIELDPDLARTEPDVEIQDLIRASAGLNVALDFLPGAMTFDPVVFQPDALLASKIVWFDAFVTNVDRTARNTNMLIWHRQLRLDRSRRRFVLSSLLGAISGTKSRMRFP